MTLARRTLQRLLLGLLAPLGALAVLAAARPLAADYLLVNETRSVPRGLYVRRPSHAPAVGDLVAVPQPVLARGYLSSLGVPPDLPLLKRIAALGGAPVCRRGDRLQVGGRFVPVRAHDRRGAVLPSWRGCRRLAAGEVLLLGDSDTSFDSRYFGPVSLGDLGGVYGEIVRW